jgi:hypothetical protein
MEFDAGICQTDAPVVFFPVRHHSPACARLVRQLALEIQPSVILIEGPSDFGDRLPELTLPHQLPIAIYSYIQLADGQRRGAFYPFCVYSPEWQAIQVARELSIPFQLIDLPWADVAAGDAPIHRYADAEFRQSQYVANLCQKLGVESFDTLWDTLFEIDPNLTPEHYLERCHYFCFHMRITEGQISETDLRREAFMIQQIRAAMRSHPGQILVVTGGFHSYPLYEQIFACAEGTQPHDPTIQLTSASPSDQPYQERGLALTPYSYQRLDSLTGYNSGMPNPGFYHVVWQHRSTGQTDVWRSLLAQVAKDLRQKEQVVSAADLIAVETMARGLATLRGHAEVWRQDLIDGIIGALVKEELEYGCIHPFLQAVHAVFRGQERGRLAAGTMLPLLVQNIQTQLHHFDLEPAVQERKVDLDLAMPSDLAKSQFLYCLRILGVSGFLRTDGSDFIGRQHLVRVWEQWTLKWHPEFDASCIEAAIYGATLVEAAIARLTELAQSIERDAEKAAILLLDACLMGLPELGNVLYAQFVELIRQDGQFFTTAKALEHLLYLYRYDEILGTTERLDIGTLLVETFQRCLWLLEGLGQVQGMEQNLLRGLRAVLEAFERCSSLLGLERDRFIQILHRISTDAQQIPLMQGATTGVLWTLGETPMQQILADLNFAATPDHLGDFLTGLFFMAREAAQRHPELVQKIDQFLMAYDDESFLEALPALRLAFSSFTPREKHHMTRTLLNSLEPDSEEKPLVDLEVSVEQATAVMAFEAKLFQAVRRYGLRGGQA